MDDSTIKFIAIAINVCLFALGKELWTRHKARKAELLLREGERAAAAKQAKVRRVT